MTNHNSPFQSVADRVSCESQLQLTVPLSADLGLCSVTYNKQYLRGYLQQLENTHNTITTENRTHIDINYFDHKDLGNHVLR
jgi:hypothetical protein